ncbi:hypothetical protein J5X84_37390 [Streptosporangiaceae bacterium NEAU-GS5]|nr:hypothetical protein [Streptosporangiaceae bacterium NEAU-GS5]
MWKHSIAVRLLATAAVGVLAASVLPATAAQAALSDCSSGQWNNWAGWQGRCLGTTRPGTDKYRAIAYCIRENGSTRTAYGPWVLAVPQLPYSIAQCSVNYWAYDGTLETA